MSMNHQDSFERPSSFDQSTNHDSMMIVAARIQQQASRVAKAQSDLEKNRAQFQTSLIQKKKHQETNREHRRKQLECIIGKCQAELDLFASQDCVREQRLQNEAMEREIEVAKAQNDQIQAQHQEDIETLYAPHEMQMQQIRKTLLGKIREAQKRQAELDQHQRNTRQLKRARKDLIRERQELLADSENLQKETRDGIMEISRLAEHVKQALTQRSDLRRSLREAKEILRNLESQQIEQKP